jgi:hypothetical protein
MKNTNSIKFEDLPKDLQEIIDNKGNDLGKSIYWSEYQNPNSFEWILEDEWRSDANMEFIFKLNDKYYLSKHSRCGCEFLDFEYEKEFPEISPRNELKEIRIEIKQIVIEYLIGDLRRREVLDFAKSTLTKEELQEIEKEVSEYIDGTFKDK